VIAVTDLILTSKFAKFALCINKNPHMTSQPMKQLIEKLQIQLSYQFHSILISMRCQVVSHSVNVADGGSTV